MILVTNTLTGSATGRTKAVDLRGLTFPGRGGLRENLRPHTISAEFSTPPDVSRHEGNLSSSPLPPSHDYMKICLMFHGNVLFSAGSEKLRWSSFCIPAS